MQSRLDDIQEASKWYNNAIKKIKDEGEIQVAERRENAWQVLISKTINLTELVLYAQRKFLASRYPEFDPTSPTKLLDTEQPWDLDHIHPQNYVQSVNNLPPIIRAWHSTIGNLRAWPSEINRAQHDLDPARKIETPNRQEKYNYRLTNSAELRTASAIWAADDWIISHPGNSSGAPHHYLRNYSLETHGKYQINRQALIRAITTRYVNLYACWYNELCIRKLF